MNRAMMKIADVFGGPGAERADEEQHGRDHHHAAAADPVGQPAGGERAERAAEQDRADIETDAQLAETEGPSPDRPACR